MSILKRLCFIFVLILIPVLSGCKKSPNEVDVHLVKYTKNGITYSAEINKFSFFDQFRDTSVDISFSDNSFILKILDNQYSGNWSTEKESTIYNSKKGATFFKMWDTDGNNGQGYSAKYFFDGSWDEMQFTFAGESYYFNSEATYDNTTTDYSLDQELSYECEILNECLTYKKFIKKQNINSFYKTSGCYEYGEITKEGNNYLFNGNTTIRLDLSKGFFYTYNSTIEYSDCIKTGTCILKTSDYSSSDEYYAVFYL